MKNKITKILTTTIISAVSATAIGCSSTNAKLAKNIDKSMAEFVSSINNLDYVDTTNSSKASNEKIGKIVETSSTNQTKSNNFQMNGNQLKYINNTISNLDIENTITRPDERTDNFKLFVLSEAPYIAFSSDDNSKTLYMNIKFSTNKIEETSNEINTKINTLILNRSILMIYVNEIYNNNVNLTENDKVAINAYVNVIKENTSFLNGNRGMVKNQLSLASDLVTNENNDNLVNYYIIKSGEALETRANKIDSSIKAINSIIEIIEANLTTSSNYYKSNLSSTYENLLNNFNTNTSSKEITKDSTNKEIAESIANSLGFCNPTTSTEDKTTVNKANNNEANSNNQTAALPTKNPRPVTNSPINNLPITSAPAVTQNQNNTTQNTINQPATNNQASTQITQSTDTNRTQNPQITRDIKTNPIIKNNSPTFPRRDTELSINQYQNQTSQNEPGTGLKFNNNRNTISPYARSQSVAEERRRRIAMRNNETNQSTRNIVPNPNLNNTNKTNESQTNTENTNNLQTYNSQRPYINIEPRQANNPNYINQNNNQGATDMQNDDKVYRATRTPESSTKEQLNSTMFSNDHRPTTNHASRVPYRTMETFNKK